MTERENISALFNADADATGDEMLTEKQLMEAVDYCCSLENCRAVEQAVIAAYEAKLREQNEPVAWTDETGYVWPNDDKHIKSNMPLYRHPTPMPEEKLREQNEPVAEVDKDDYNQWADILPNVSVKVGDKLYLHPAQIPEGWQLVPIEPTDKMWFAGVVIKGDMAASYKAMLAAARSE